MKVEKIKLVKELLEIPDHNPIWRERTIPPIYGIQTEGEIPTTKMETFKDEVYEVRQVMREFYDEPKNYLIKVDDRKIFDDLMVINRDDLQNFIDKAIDKSNRVLLHDFNYRIFAIKNMRWWKRLFNQF